MSKAEKPRQNLYLLGLSEDELSEVYEGLILKDELMRRVNPQAEESPFLKRIADQLSERVNYDLRSDTVTLLDEYLDGQIDDELMWQKIEDELKKKLGE